MLTTDSCSSCNDIGFVVDGSETRSCTCRKQRNIRLSIDQYPELRGIGKLDGLVSRVDGKIVPLAGNAIVRCRWSDFRCHLVGWLAANLLAGKSPKLEITSDIELRARWLGRNPNANDNEASSTLDVIRQFDLVVVQVKRVKHKATPQALLEATVYAKALWLVHEPTDTLGDGHPSWSPDLEAATENFQKLDLNPSVEALTAESVDDLLGISGPKGGYDA